VIRSGGPHRRNERAERDWPGIYQVYDFVQDVSGGQVARRWSKAW